MEKNEIDKLTNYFISDLYEPESDNKNLEDFEEEPDDSVMRYKKIKTVEKKMNEIADTINNLEENDRQNVLESMKENAKNNEQKNRYNKLVNLIKKGYSKQEKLKNLIKEKALKNLGEEKPVLKEFELKPKKKLK